MAQQGTVAPKERINVSYKSETGGVEKSVELPMKIMAVGDYTCRADDRLIENRKPININSDNFNDVMNAQNLNLKFDVVNKLTDDSGDDLVVDITFNNINDFQPEQVARQVPELNKLLELRDALVALKGPLGNIPAFRKVIESTIQDEEQKKQILSELNIG